MNTDDFIRAIGKKTGYTIGDCNEFLCAFINVINDCVKEREEVKIVNFGVLSFAKVKARTVKGNPNFLDGKDKEYKETEKMFLRLSQTLKKLLKETKKQEVIEQFL